MASSITADNDTIMQQAHMAAGVYVDHARHGIDGVFGLGYAAKHPELVAAYMHTAALGFGAGIMAKELANAIEEVANALVQVADALATEP